MPTSYKTHKKLNGRRCCFFGKPIDSWFTSPLMTSPPPTRSSGLFVEEAASPFTAISEIEEDHEVLNNNHDCGGNNFQTSCSIPITDPLVSPPTGSTCTGTWYHTTTNSRHPVVNEHIEETSSTVPDEDSFSDLSCAADVGQQTKNHRPSPVVALWRDEDDDDLDSSASFHEARSSEDTQVDSPDTTSTKSRTEQQQCNSEALRNQTGHRDTTHTTQDPEAPITTMYAEEKKEDDASTAEPPITPQRHKINTVPVSPVPLPYDETAAKKNISRTTPSPRRLRPQSSTPPRKTSPRQKNKKSKKLIEYIRHDLNSKDPDTILPALQHLAETAATYPHTRGSIARIGGLLAVVRAMEDHPTHAPIQIAACHALEKLALDEENERAIAEIGGVDAVLGAMMCHFGHAPLHEAAWSTLWNLTCCNSADKMTIDTAGGMEAIVSCMKQHVQEAAVQKNACGALANLCLHKDERLKALAEAGGFVAIATALQTHWDNEEVRKEASYALSVLLEAR